jgi:hypothetical protein
MEIFGSVMGLGARLKVKTFSKETAASKSLKIDAII